MATEYLKINIPEIYFLWDFGYWSRRNRRGHGASIPKEVNRLNAKGYWKFVREIKGKRIILMSTDLSAGSAEEILRENGCQVTTSWNNQGALEAHLQNPADIFLIDYWNNAAGADLVTDLVGRLKLAEIPQQQIVL